MMRRIFTLAIITLHFALASLAMEPEVRRIQQQHQAIEANDADCITVSNQTVTITNNTSDTCTFSIYCGT